MSTTDSDDAAAGRMASLEIIEAGPEDADASILLLHGLGADGADLAGLAPHVHQPDGARWRFLFPTAPMRPVTINGGAVMRAWYDIDPARGLDSGSDDIRASADLTRGIIAREIDRGVDPARIVVGGFSQGGVIALETALTDSHRLAGVVALSTYLHDAERADERVTLANAEAPIFMAHGRSDAMIPITRAAASRSRLEALGYRLSWHEYAMGHEVCMDEIRDLGDWLETVLAGGRDR
ncbi:MAG TPA: dienelactone hydrolase family protein [Pseudomonadales bacterium]|nr:dienelactone hydrolase family protein [Pseudomonadales bacterium]